MRQLVFHVLRRTGASRGGRVLVSAVFGILVGLGVVCIIPALYLANLCAGASECANGDWVLPLTVVTVFSHFVTVPIAILVGSFAYVRLDSRMRVITSLPAVTVSGRAVSVPDLWPPVPKARIFRVAGAGWLVLLVIWGVGLADWVYRKNRSCGPDNGPIQSSVDAITRAQKLISKARYLPHDIPGYVDEKPYVVDFGRTETCCSVTRTRTWLGVIVWEVSLSGETIGEPRNRRVSAKMMLSNCGVVFDEDSLVSAEPVDR